MSPNETPTTPLNQASDALRPAGPQRRCIVTRRTLARADMLRFVLDPEQTVIFDPEATLPGRGLWLCAHRDVLETATSKGAFAKAAKCSVRVPTDLVERVDALLTDRCVGLLGFARKAGQAVCGFQKVRSWLRADSAGLVFAASDGSQSEIDRLAAAERGIPVSTVFDRWVLGKAFGRDEAVHAAIARGPFVEKLDIRLRRLTTFHETGMASQTGRRRGAKSERSGVGATSEE